MQFGVDLKLKNARVHTPLDLATDQDTRALIQQGIKTPECKGNKCNNSKFDFRNIQFYCGNCGDFYCKRCSTMSWVFEKKDSESEERPVCRCDNCFDFITQSEKNLRSAMATNDYETVHKVFDEIRSNNVDIDVKLFDAAEVLHLKLEK